MSKVEGGGGSIDPHAPCLRLRVAIFSSRLLGLIIKNYIIYDKYSLGD